MWASCTLVKVCIIFTHLLTHVSLPAPEMWTSQVTAWRCQWAVGMVTMASWPPRRSSAGRSWPSSSWSSPSMPMSCSMATLLFCATQTELWLFNACFHMFWTTSCITFRRKSPSSSVAVTLCCAQHLNWVFFFRARGDFVPLVCSQLTSKLANTRSEITWWWSSLSSPLFYRDPGPDAGIASDLPGSLPPRSRLRHPFPSL